MNFTREVSSLRTLDDEKLIALLKEAIAFSLDEEFIQLIELEVDRRKTLRYLT